MRKKLIALSALALVLTGCSASFEDAATKCGGSDAGISVRSDGSIKYDQELDSTGDAWVCLLTALVPDKTDRYTISIGLDDTGTSGDIDSNGHTIVWGTSPSGVIRLFFS